MSEDNPVATARRDHPFVAISDASADASNAELRQAIREYQVIVDNTVVGISFVVQRVMQRCNQRFNEIYGYAPGELDGRPSSLLYPSHAAFEAFGRAAYDTIRRGEAFAHEARMRRRDGSEFWCSIRGKAVDPAQPDAGSIWIVEDIDARRSAQQALERTLLEQRLILDNALVGFVFLRDRRVVNCNLRFEQMLGYAPGELDQALSSTWYTSEEEWQRVGRLGYSRMRTGQPYVAEMLLRRKDGGTLWCHVSGVAIEPESIERGSIWIIVDISERHAAQQALQQTHKQLEARVAERTRELAEALRKLRTEIADREQAQAQVRHMAYHDPLTDLPNRVLLREHLVEALVHTRAAGCQGALLFLDLDRFKNINDSLGHPTGDQLLIEVSDRLRTLVRPPALVARVGGDEFMVVLPRIRDEQEAMDFADRLREQIGAPLRISGLELYVTPSIGIATFPGDQANAEDLIRDADTALYHAKALGRDNWQLFRPTMKDLVTERLTVESHLRRALTRGELRLHYQPRLDAASGRVVCVEALLRWQHPQWGMVAPDRFIPLAEEVGLIEPIGQWVLREAMQQLARWRAQGLCEFRVAINLSPRQLHRRSAEQDILSALAESGLAADCVELEITESSLLEQPEATRALLQRLRDAGMWVAVDDFGTGYANLGLLKSLPLDCLKIDKLFMYGIPSDAANVTIARAIVTMAHGLGLRVVAEGIETPEQYDFLRAEGCEEVQGFLFSRALPPEQIPLHPLLHPA